MDPVQRRPRFGNRHLDSESDVYSQNAWDNVTWDEDFKREVTEQIDLNAKVKVTEEKAQELECNAPDYWDKFYDNHENKFFKDRHWILTEFPELIPADHEEPKKILELGCGVGNTVFPLLELDPTGTQYYIYCCDFSEKAIQLVREHPLYDPRRCEAFVLDITSADWTPLPSQSNLDIITMIFVLSAIDPDRHQTVVEQTVRHLRPGGLLLFRDYGQYDMAQVRFGTGRCIKDRFYVRGDGTRAYFFHETEIDHLFTRCGLVKVNLRIDRRLQINRANKKKMYRVWIQGTYRKKETETANATAAAGKPD